MYVCMSLLQCEVLNSILHVLGKNIRLSRWDLLAVTTSPAQEKLQGPRHDLHSAATCVLQHPCGAMFTFCHCCCVNPQWITSDLRTMAVSRCLSQLPFSNVCVTTNIVVSILIANGTVLVLKTHVEDTGLVIPLKCWDRFQLWPCTQNGQRMFV